MTELASSEGKLQPAADAAAGRNFPCDRCGADLAFLIGVQKLKCPYCGGEKDLSSQAGVVSEQDLVRTLERLGERRAQTAPALGEHEVRCDSCGANVVFNGTLTATSCAYCGSPIQRQGVHEAKSDRLPVDAVLTFAVEAGTAKAKLAAWVGSRWFAPGEFKTRGAQGKLEGVYVPYFSFDAMTATHYYGRRGEHYEVRVGSGKDERTERRTRWDEVSGFIQHFFDDVLVAGARSLPAKLLTALEPWPLARCRPFTPEILAGSFAHTYDVELGEAFKLGKARIERALETQVKEDIGGDEQRISEMTTQYSALSYKHLLLPVWLLAYRYGDKSYRVAVNACTAEVQGERPYSAVKIALAVLGGLVVLGIIASLAQR
jgi:predicted RNA-binding Zn-ribbon protein involved in translation (DUF1610 family)